MPDATATQTGPEQEEPSIFDLPAAMERVDGDADLFRTMAELFVEQGPQDLAEAQAALAAGDAAAVARSAHRLKGAVLQFCAPTVFALTKRLEELGKAGDLNSAPAVCAQLHTELLRLCAALRPITTNGGIR